MTYVYLYNLQYTYNVLVIITSTAKQPSLGWGCKYRK